MHWYYVILICVVIALAFAGLIKWLVNMADKRGEDRANGRMQTETSNKLWEEAEYDKHLDSIRPNSARDVARRVREGRKG